MTTMASILLSSYYFSSYYYKFLLDLSKVWQRIHSMNLGEECFGLRELQMQRLIMTLACLRINNRERERLEQSIKDTKYEEMRSLR